jgi:hypothetical protein
MSLLDELDQGGGGDEQGVNWRPTTPGESIEGTVERLSSIETDYGTLPIAEVRDAQGVLHSVFAKGSLAKDFSFAQLSPGDALAVRYDGQRTSGAGRTYNAFRSVVRKPDGRLVKTSDRLDFENPEKAKELAEARARRAAEAAQQQGVPRAAPVGAAELDQQPQYQQAAPAAPPPGWGPPASPAAPPAAPPASPYAPGTPAGGWPAGSEPPF